MLTRSRIHRRIRTPTPWTLLRKTAASDQSRNLGTMLRAKAPLRRIPPQRVSSPVPGTFAGPASTARADFAATEARPLRHAKHLSKRSSPTAKEPSRQL